MSCLQIVVFPTPLGPLTMTTTPGINSIRITH